jgi:transcriptional regulator with XRE-family HTH domain
MNNDEQVKTTRIKELLIRKGLTQRELAERSGTAPYKISHLCQGMPQDLMLSTAFKIARVLKCSVEEVFGDMKFND